MRKDIYLAFTNRLNNNQTDIKHISLWNDNVANLEAEIGFSMPATFLEFMPITWQQQGQGQKTARMQVRVHIVISSLKDPSDGALYQDEALAVFDTIEGVVDALTGMTGEGFNRWQHVATESDLNYSVVQHHIESFEFQCTVPSKKSKGELIENVKPIIHFTV